MEENLNYEQINDSSINNTEIIDYLYTTSKWANFLAILGYISIGLMLLESIIMILFFSVIQSAAPMAFPFKWMGFIYIPMAILYFFPVNFLHKFALRVRRGIDRGDMLSFTSGFKNLKSLFKFTGIMTIIMMSLIILFVIGAIATAALMMPKM